MKALTGTDHRPLAAVETSVLAKHETVSMYFMTGCNGLAT